MSATPGESALLLCYAALVGELADAGVIQRSALSDRLRHFDASDPAVEAVLGQIASIIERGRPAPLKLIMGGKADGKLPPAA